MNHIEVPDNQTILVFANYRCGSTALCDILSKQTGLPNLDELFHPRNNRKFDYINKTGIIKIMPDHPLPQDFDTLLQKSFVVGIQRKSIVNQIASFYIAHRQHVWHVKKNQPSSSYTVEIDKLDLKDQIAYILLTQQKYNRYNFPIDLVLYYEDIIHNLGASTYDVYHKPDNYDNLIKLIKQQIDQIQQRITSEQN